jgi:hypothetical protein
MTNRPIWPAAAILALGMVAAAAIIGQSVIDARLADRAVTVRGLAEQDVTADLASWSLAATAQGADMTSLQQRSERDAEAIIAFLKSKGFTDDEIETGAININQYTNQNGRPNITIRRDLTLRTNRVMAARDAYAAQGELVRAGVIFASNSGGMAYSFTRLSEVKPAMIAAATKDARAGADQFAKDSGASVGAIKSASQGYFSIIARDGTGSRASASPFQKVRVVTTINFTLE